MTPADLPDRPDAAGGARSTGGKLGPAGGRLGRAGAVSPADRLRALLSAEAVTHLPGVYDPPTAALAVHAGHRAAHLSGAACAALDLGLPDLGYVHGTHIAARAALITPALGDVPLLADADTGYGDALQAVWTARRYAAAGVAGLHLEDQVLPKRCGHLAGKELIALTAAATKIRAVAEAGTGLVIVARTDAFSVAGLAEVIDRCGAYLAAGADAVFPEGVDDPADLATLHAALPHARFVLNRSEAATSATTTGSGGGGGPGGGTGPMITGIAWQSGTTRPSDSPIARQSERSWPHDTGPHDTGPRDAGLGRALPDDATLAGLGVRFVLHPVAPLLAALRAADEVYRSIAQHGHSAGIGKLSWSGFTDLVGQPAALDIDGRYAR